MTPEAKVKKKVKVVLDALGAWYFFPAMGLYGRRGVPDIIGCLHGKFFAIECKAGGKEPTALQHFELQKIATARGLTYVVNEGIDLEQLKRDLYSKIENQRNRIP